MRHPARPSSKNNNWVHGTWLTNGYIYAMKKANTNGNTITTINTRVAGSMTAHAHRHPLLSPNNSMSP
jgi:hypothetical protein